MINNIVDIFNYLSARFLFPISVWDVERSGGTVFEFRLGKDGESYPFNASGHVIHLTDLIVGCVSNHVENPVVSPVKDAHCVKVDVNTTRTAAAIYIPESEFGKESEELMNRGVSLVRAAGTEARITRGCIRYGETIEIPDA